MSFLAFGFHVHWETFMAQSNTQDGGVGTKLVDRDAISAWELTEDSWSRIVFDGDKGHHPDSRGDIGGEPACA